MAFFLYELREIVDLRFRLTAYEYSLSYLLILRRSMLPLKLFRKKLPLGLIRFRLLTLTLFPLLAGKEIRLQSVGLTLFFHRADTESRLSYFRYFLRRKRFCLSVRS